MQKGLAEVVLRLVDAAGVAFAKAEGFEIKSEFTEVEIGKDSDALDRRPELKVALKEAKKAKCEVLPLVRRELARAAKPHTAFLGALPAVASASTDQFPPPQNQGQ